MSSGVTETFKPILRIEFGRQLIEGDDRYWYTVTWPGENNSEPISATHGMRRSDVRNLPTLLADFFEGVLRHYEGPPRRCAHCGSPIKPFYRVI